MTEQMSSLIENETPKSISNVETKVIGSVNQLCRSAAKTCAELGYEPVILTSSLSCTAKDAGVFLSNIAQQYTGDAKKRAFIAGGETVVHITGSGLGGRNQELAGSRRKHSGNAECLRFFRRLGRDRRSDRCSRRIC